MNKRKPGRPKGENNKIERLEISITEYEYRILINLIELEKRKSKNEFIRLTNKSKYINYSISKYCDELYSHPTNVNGEIKPNLFEERDRRIERFKCYLDEKFEKDFKDEKRDIRLEFRMNDLDRQRLDEATKNMNCKNYTDLIKKILYYHLSMTYKTLEELEKANQ